MFFNQIAVHMQNFDKSARKIEKRPKMRHKVVMHPALQMTHTVPQIIYVQAMAKSNKRIVSKEAVMLCQWGSSLNVCLVFQQS